MLIPLPIMERPTNLPKRVFSIRVPHIFFPSEYMSLNIETVYDDENNHIYTKHFAASSYKKMQVFLYEMGLDNEEDVKEFYEISNKNKQTIEVNK